MQDINTNLFKIISCVKHIKVEMTEINIFIILFVKNDYNNDLFLNCF